MTVIELIKALEPLAGCDTNVVAVGVPYYTKDGPPVHETSGGKPEGNNYVAIFVEAAAQASES